MKTCQWPEGCDGEVVAHGLCMRHYQRKYRKKGPPASSKPGPARKYPELEKKSHGAPLVSFRVEPDLWRWIEAQGGAQWARTLLRGCQRLSADPDFAGQLKRLEEAGQ
jgi:hypothetical protein